MPHKCGFIDKSMTSFTSQGHYSLYDNDVLGFVRGGLCGRVVGASNNSFGFGLHMVMRIMPI
jgi:hypothetical protein